MVFRSIYAHGFLRVAACTIETSIADPARNAEAILAASATCHGRGVGLAVFPELCLSGYAIEDLLLQDTLLDAVETAIHRIAAAPATISRFSWSARLCAIAIGSITPPW